MNSTELDERGLVIACPNCGQRNRMLYERLGQVFRCGKCQQHLQAPGEPIAVTDPNHFDALRHRSALPVLVDFWATWCGPCKMMAPELDKAARQGAGQWLTVKLNTEVLPDLAQQYRITGIPTLVLFRDGQEVARQSGAIPAAAIRQFAERAALAPG